MEHEFYSIDNLDDRYQYFSKHSEKNFSKEKFKEVIDFLEEQTKKIKHSELPEEVLKNVFGGEDVYIPQTDSRRNILILKSFMPYISENFQLGSNIGEVINLIEKKIKYETENEELQNLREEEKNLRKQMQEKGLI